VRPIHTLITKQYGNLIIPNLLPVHRRDGACAEWEIWLAT
jgi:hypothetical protein